MNVVMIGTGDIAYSHGRAVVKLGGAVIAAFDVNRAGLEKYCAEFGSEALSYEQLDEWIPKADYVVLCTPPTKRLDYVEKVLSAHVPLYMEKPIATTLEDAKKLKDMEQKYDAKSSSALPTATAPPSRSSTSWLLPALWASPSTSSTTA